MYPALDAVEEQLNDALALKANLTDPRLTDQRTPLDGSVTSAKIVNGTIVNADVSDTAAIAYTKVTRPPLSNASDVAIDAGTLSGGQVIKYNAGTSNWVNGAAAGGVTASATAPTLATAAAGDAWFDTNDGTLYVCYVDVDSTKQWVQVQANSALEGSILARLGALESQSIAYGTMSPNYVINGGMDFMQRSATPTTGLAMAGGIGYQMDRWTGQHASTGTVSRQASSLTGIPLCARVQRNSGNTNTASPIRFSQSLESSQSNALAGSTITFSFYARRGANFSGASNQITAAVYSGTGTDQNLLSGFTGNVDVIAQPTILTTTWQRFSYTASVASNVNQLGVDFYYYGVGTAGANDWFEIAGVQLERGSVATSFRRNAPSIQGELAACQRYYVRCTGDQVLSPGFARTSTVFTSAFSLPVEMRTTPTIETNTSSGVNFATVETGDQDFGSMTVSKTSGSNSGTRAVGINATNSGAAMIVGRGGVLRLQGSTAFVGFIAEL
jgi:hypothetical protein